MAAVSLRRKGVLSVLALIWLSLAVSVLWSTQKTKIGVSLAEAGPMRAADNSGAPAVSDYVPAGAQLEVLRQLDGWTEVRLGSGRRGWLPMRSVKRC